MRLRLNCRQRDSTVTGNRAFWGDGIYTSAALTCEGTSGDTPLLGIHGHEYTDVWLTGPDSSLEADVCDFGEDSNGNPVGQVYIEETDTTHPYGNDETFTLTP